MDPPSTPQQEIPSDIPKGSRYQPVPPVHYYGRPQDASFRDARSTGFGRNILRLWLSPIRVEGQPVWVGLANRELTQQKRSAKNQKLDLDEVRSFFLQNFWYSQGVAWEGMLNRET